MFTSYPSGSKSLSLSGSLGSVPNTSSSPLLNPSLSSSFAAILSSPGLSIGFVPSAFHSTPSLTPPPSVSQLFGLVPIPISSPSVNPSLSVSGSVGLVSCVFISSPSSSSSPSVSSSVGLVS